MGDTEVLIKIAADVASAVAAMQSMVEQVMAMIAAMKDVADQSGKTGDDVADMHKKMAAGAGESVASGIQLSKVYDVIKESIVEAVKSFPEMITKAAEAGDHFQTLSNRLNVSVESLAEMDFISKQSGASMEGMARTVQSLGTILSDSGSKGAKGIKSIGLSVDDLKAMKPEEAFFTILEAIQQLPPGIDKNAKAMEIFGGKFRSQTMLLKEPIEELRQTFIDLGGGMTGPLAAAGDSWNDTLNELQLKQETWKNQTAGAMLPTLTALAKEMEKLPAPVLIVGETVVDLGKKFLTFSQNMIASQGWTKYKDQMLGVVTQFGDVKTAVLDFSKSGANSLLGFAEQARSVSWGDVFGGIKDTIKTVGGSLLEFGKSIPTDDRRSDSGPDVAGLDRGRVRDPAFWALVSVLGALVSPVGIVVIALVALGAAIYELMGGWDGIKKSIAAVIVFFKDLWTIVTHLGDIWASLSAKVGKLISDFKGAGMPRGFLGTAVKVVSSIFEAWVGLIEKLTAWIPPLFNISGVRSTTTRKNSRTPTRRKRPRSLPRKTTRCRSSASRTGSNRWRMRPIRWAPPTTG